MTFIIVICAAALAASILAIAIAAALGAAAAREDARRSKARSGLTAVAQIAVSDVAAEADGFGHVDVPSAAVEHVAASGAAAKAAPGAKCSYAGLAFMKTTISFVPPVPSPSGIIRSQYRLRRP